MGYCKGQRCDIDHKGLRRSRQEKGRKCRRTTATSEPDWGGGTAVTPGWVFSTLPGPADPLSAVGAGAGAGGVGGASSSLSGCSISLPSSAGVRSTGKSPLSLYTSLTGVWAPEFGKARGGCEAVADAAAPASLAILSTGSVNEDEEAGAGVEPDRLDVDAAAAGGAGEGVDCDFAGVEGTGAEEDEMV